ncbi:sperm flagellar protein 2 isoform X2 [Neopelma chrysocephalum]|uniref:sperm flagellar protein 2 isoform X2 n=1 Tax=Neopelma chrysocephalum TaxID=114329 RepID=UPI000FCD2DDD|nr:sperm flagellar protein 2 isoform X2 [Neopelma chrysocephalum]
MSRILCEWLNEEVKLSRRVVPGSFPEEFSNGYLLGELLHKYGLQDDFKQFSQSRVADAKVNNFSRLEPTLHLLGVPFNESVAQDIMTGQHGAATKLLYELYIALEKKRKAKHPGVVMEAIRPAATTNLKSIESVLYPERLKTLVPRQADLQLQQISERFEAKSKAVADKIARTHFAEQQRAQKLREEQRAQDIEKDHIGRRRQSEVAHRIQPAVLKVPKPPPRPIIKAIEAKKLLKKREAENVYKEIDKFEKSMTGNAFELHSQVTDSDMQESLQTQKLQETTQETIQETTAQTKTELLGVYSDGEYIRKIQKRVEEDTFAREQRAKRRRKMLMDQLLAHESEEKAYREEQLVYRLMKQSQHERRIAAQLMHVRHEKEVLRQNRIFREKQYEERRQKEFQEALDREAALAKQENIDNEEQIMKEREQHEKIAAERAQARYKKHYSMCWEVMGQIIDMSTKVGEYRHMTKNRVPLKLMLDWKEFFLNGKPIYEQASIQPLPNEPGPEQLVEMNKMSLLDEKDYGEYKSMTGEWSPTEENSENKPPPNNNILGHVLRRLMELFYPPQPKPSPRVLTSFPIKGCILGKIFSGKTTCAKFIEKVCNIQVLSVDTLVWEAIQSFLKNEMKSEHDIIPHEKSSGEQNKLSVRAQLGAASQKWLKKGKSIPDELLIDLLLEAINQIPPEKGWFVEGFPMTINQAKLFDKAYTGNDPEEKDASPGRLSLVIDPRAPNEPPVISPAFDVSVLLDISDTVVLKRAANMKLDKSKSSETEQENGDQNSDPEILEEKIDLDKDQVLHRISGFLDTWPKLEKWFSVHQNILVSVNAETEESHVCETVKEIIIEEIAKKQNRRSTQEIAPAEEKPLPDTEEKPLPDTEEKPLPGTEEKPLPGTEEKPLPCTDDLLPPSPETPPPPVEPGSDEWIYVDEPLPQEIIDFLVPYWEMIENAYINTIKTILRCLRDEQYTMIHYIADIRENFQDYLKRPDLKQEFVSQWQRDFNSISDDLRDDEETKAELHQRVTDLRDLLWDICDSRREEAEQERVDIMNKGWLPDHRGIAMNHFFSLMQVEVDRFQDTKRILHDYYRSMEGKIPTEDSKDFTRIPLLDIFDVKQKEDVEQKEDEDKSRRIPLVSWKLFSPEINTETENNETLQASPNVENSANGRATYRNDKRLIIYTWQKAVTAVSNMVTAEIEFREMEDEDQQQQKLKEDPKRSGKAAGKDVRKPSTKSLPKKKGSRKKVSVITLDPEELKKQELALKIKQEHLSALKHEEAATKSRLELIKEKALAFLEDLKMKAEEAYRDMEKWLGSTFLAEMASVEKLVEAARYHVESSSKIQYEMTLEETDFFINGDVKMFPDPVPDPVPTLEVPRIKTSRSTLTISQLTKLHKQFLQVAPKALKCAQLCFFKRTRLSTGKRKKISSIRKKEFIDIFSRLVNLNRGVNCLPDQWMNLKLPDLENLASAFSVNAEFTDWRRFLVAAAQPWPVPSVTQLLKTLHSFKAVDVAGSGFVTEEYYMQVGLWFNGDEDLSITKSCTQSVPLDRLKHLIKFFFSLFADTRKDPALLDYTEMLLYFASHSDPVEGIYRALSIATGTYVHRKKEASHPCADSPYPSTLSNEKTLKENEKEVLNYTGKGVISVATLFKVFHTGGRKDQDNHRFSDLEKAGNYDEHFIKIYKELGIEDLTPIPVELLLIHSFMKDLINSYQGYKLHDIKIFLQRAKQAHPTDGGEKALKHH